MRQSLWSRVVGLAAVGCAAVLSAAPAAKPPPRPPWTVLDQMPPVNLPELMKTFDGKPVRTVEDWERTRRPELLDFFARNMHGVRPVERPADLAFAPTAPDAVMKDGTIVRKQVRATFSGPYGPWSFNILAFLPRTSRPVPVFVLICNRALEKNVDPELKVKSEFCPVEAIVARGYALAIFKNTELALDEYPPALADGKVVVQDPPFTNGFYACFAPERTYRSWGAISAWAWGASRVLDWVETEPLLDAKHFGVVGHSRGGKTSLLAGVTDTRFAMACVNDSGCSGAKLNHIDLPKSESIARITKVFPHWFCLNYRNFAGKEFEMGFDQHMMVALMAPRAVAIASASKDHWAGQRGEYASALLASPAWELYGKRGLVSDGFPNPGEARQDGTVSYHLREGVHNLTLHDWNRYMDFADRLGWRRP